ncbi:MAG TPA: type II secretion system F family protein [Acidobacteriota bacterium]|nr:type II secretion system F family protein [Acidobacteriota bacterium]
MPVYEFRGRQLEGGSLVTGERFALNKQALATSLRNENILPVRINEKKGQISFKLPGTGVSAKDLALFTRQFSVMLDAGLPLVQCLGIMADQQEKAVFKNTLNEVREEVEAGSTLAEAMRKHPKVFDTLFVNMIAAGEAAGVLDVILGRLSFFVEKAVKLRRSVLSASVYPAVVLSVAVIIVFAIMIWVIPVFVTLFEGLNAPLPLPTRVVMAVSSFVQQFSIPIVLLALLTAFGVRSYYATENGKLVIDQLLLRLPLLGIVLKKIVIARFSRTLGTLLTSGIPILEGLEITAHTAGNAVIQQSLLDVRRHVAEGKTLVEPLKKAGIFPTMVTQVVGVGEQTGELDQMLDKLADYYEEESDNSINNFLTLLEPLMIVVLGVVVGGIVISMYMPIFSLIGHLSG